MSKKEVVLGLFVDIGNAKNRDERKRIRQEIIKVCKPVVDNICRMHIKYQQPAKGLEDYGNLLITCERAGQPLPSLKSPVYDEEWGEITFVFDAAGLDNVATLELDMLEDGAEQKLEDTLINQRMDDLTVFIEEGEDGYKKELEELMQLQKARK